MTPESKLAPAARAVMRGELIIYPTETVYGIGGDGRSQAVADEINRLKRRKIGTPLLMLVSSVEQAEAHFGKFPPLTLQLAAAFWPGPLTILTPTATAYLVGLRVSPHPIVTKLLDLIDRPLFSTSANISGTAPPHSVAELPDELIDACSVIIDDGPSTGRTASTIVNVSTGIPELVRVGPISHEEISAAIR